MGKSTDMRAYRPCQSGDGSGIHTSSPIHFHTTIRRKNETHLILVSNLIPEIGNIYRKVVYTIF